MSLPKVASAIIAGGKSSRFGPDNKALVRLSHQTVIEHIYECLSAQTDQVWLNAPDSFVAPDSLNAKRVPDVNDKQSGPLAGVLAAMEEATKDYEWLLICPCDTPFIPKNLCTVLYDACVEQKVDLAIAESKGRYHPSVSLWNKRLLEPLQNAVYEHQKAGFKQFYPETKHCFVDWPVNSYDPFFNINYSEDLQTANALFDKLFQHK